MMFDRSLGQPLGRPWRPIAGALIALLAVGMLTLASAAHGPATPPGSTPADAAPADAAPAASAHAESTLPEPPPLPFDDNPDPNQCGIPGPLGDGVYGTVHGSYQGELVFEEVHLYDSHLRSAVTGLVPDGTRVQAVLFQVNPTLNYYMVRWAGPDGTVEGWLPAPFFELER